MASPEILFEVFYGVSSPWAFFGAPQVAAICKKYDITPHLRPIVIIEENGGIPLRKRPDPRQAYHELELKRWRAHYDIPLNLKPKYYPLPPGKIQISAQAIIRVQNELGAGHEKVLSFSYAIQRALWVEERDLSRVVTLKEIAREVGLEESLVQRACVDRTMDEDDPAHQEWLKNLKDAEKLGCFGTPNYVVNGELFWGQDRLDFVDRAIAELSKKS